MDDAKVGIITLWSSCGLTSIVIHILVKKYLQATGLATLISWVIFWAIALISGAALRDAHRDSLFFVGVLFSLPYSLAICATIGIPFFLARGGFNFIKK